MDFRFRVKIPKQNYLDPERQFFFAFGIFFWVGFL